jgi:hypothetical protein
MVFPAQKTVLRTFMLIKQRNKFQSIVNGQIGRSGRIARLRVELEEKTGKGNCYEEQHNSN